MSDGLVRAAKVGMMVPPSYQGQRAKSRRYCSRCGARLALDQSWVEAKCSPCQRATAKPVEVFPPPHRRCPVCSGLKSAGAARCHKCRYKERETA